MTRRLIAELQKQGHYDDLNDGDASLVVTQPPQKVAGYLSMAQQRQFREVLQELAARENEALRLYEPQWIPEQERFHASYAPERIIRGSNRASKTLSACVEVARIVTNQDPYPKMPPAGRFIIVGKDLLHCSKVLYRKLFKPGAFKIIRDPDTRKFRTFRPWQGYDASHKHLARPAPPLIPARFYSVKDISWENKREETIKTVRLRTGWELTFFSSLGPPPQGWDADGALFDEEIEHPSWYPETSARLMDHVTYDEQGRKIGGKFMWSATPQAGTQRLYELSERADLVKHEPHPPIEEFFMTLLGNPFIPEEAKQELIAKLSGDEEEYRVRVLGDFAVKGMRVYPEWHPKTVQGIPFFQVPETWTRYTVTDPGRQVCAVLFCAVPPPDHAYHGSYLIYDELYIKKASAEIYGQRMAEKCGPYHYQDFLIDHQAGRVTEMGSGRTIEEQYSDALRRHGVMNEANRYGFSWGDTDIKARLEKLRGDIQCINGVCRLLVFEEKCPNFCREMKDYSYKRVGKDKMVTDDPLQKDNHTVDCGQMMAQYEPRYVRPKQLKRRSWTNDYIAAKKKRHASASGWGTAVKLG